MQRHSQNATKKGRKKKTLINHQTPGGAGSTNKPYYICRAKPLKNREVIFKRATNGRQDRQGDTSLFVWYAAS